jgi:hypothetical protein
MSQYYSQPHLEKAEFDRKDFYSVIMIIALSFFCVFLYSRETKNVNVKIIEPYYKERFYKVPSKKVRFSNKKYDIAVSKLMLNDGLRKLKYTVKDLNRSLNSFQTDLLKQQAMNDIILMLQKVKAGEIEHFDVSKMQQAVLEAGYGNIDAKLLEKALNDYQEKVEQKEALEIKLAQEKLKTEKKMQEDSKEAAVLAQDIAREIAEEEIEGFIQNLSIIARVGHFVIQKVQDE